MSEKQKKAKRQTVASQNERMREASRGRKRKKRKRDLLVAMLCIVVVSAVAILVASFTIFYIESLEVEGNDGMYSDEEIIAAAGVADITNMLGFTAEEAAAKVERALPYIETADVHRRLPGRIVIGVTYAQPAFCAKFGEGWLLLSTTGKVLALSTTPPADTTYLAGLVLTGYTVGAPAEFTEPAGFEGAARLYTACVENGIRNVTQIDADSMGTASFVVGGQFYIRGGTATLTIEKMRLIALEIEKRAGKSAAYTITVLNDGSLSVRNRDKQETDAADAQQAFDVDLVDDDAPMFTENATKQQEDALPEIPAYDEDADGAEAELDGEDSVG